jgi:hypothetical protein
MDLSGASNKAEVATDGICFSLVLGSGLRREQGTIQRLDGEGRIPVDG